MRLIAEVFIVILLVCAGWQQPYRDHISSLFPASGITPSRPAQLAAQRVAMANAASNPNPTPAPIIPSTPAQVRPAASPTPSWLWNGTGLDHPYDTTTHVRNH